jgi:succinyl-diaminopimelate desuccinylase
LISKIDELIESYEQKLIEDTIKLVNIKSTKGEPLPGAPFGEGPNKF